MATQTERTKKKSKGNSGKNGARDNRYDFTPIEYDGEIAPDAAEGEYEAKIEGVRVQPTSRDKFPMLVIDWKLLSTATETEEAEKSVDAIVTDFITFFPKGTRTRGAQFAARRFRQLRELLDIDEDILPSKLRSLEDFADLIEKLEEEEATIWVTVRKDKETGEERANVSYTEPRGGSLAKMKDDDEDEEEEEEEDEDEEEEGEEEEEEEEDEDEEEEEDEDDDEKPAKKTAKKKKK